MTRDANMRLDAAKLGYSGPALRLRLWTPHLTGEVWVVPCDVWRKTRRVRWSYGRPLRLE